MHSLQSQLTQQHHEIAAVRQEVHSTGENLKLAMQASLQSMQQDISTEVGNKISTQMERFEKLFLAKSPRKNE